MSSFYNIDFSLASRRLLPPAKRQPVMLAWLKALLEPLQSLRDMHFEYYLNGVSRDIAPFYSSTETYNYGDWVVGSDDRIYKNISLIPLSDNDPTKHPENWLIILETYIGLNERIRYNSETMVLEYILNKKFRVRPPDYSEDGNEPQIFIDNTDDDLENVYFFRTDENYYGVNFDRVTPYSGNEEGIGDAYTDYPASFFEDGIFDLLADYDPLPTYLFQKEDYFSEFDYIVYVPEVLKSYFHIPGPLEDDQYKTIIRAETNKYNLAGVVFDVQFYPPLPPHLMP